MSNISHDEQAVKNNLFFNLLLETFPKQRSYLESATINELVAGTHPSAIINDGSEEGFDDYFIKNLFKKVENFDIGVDPIDVALKDFTSFLKEQEEKEIFVRTILETTTPDSDLGRVLQWVRSFYKRVFSDFHEHQIVPRFSTGATLTLPRGSSPLARVKLSEGQQHLNSVTYNYKDGDDRTKSHLHCATVSLPHTKGTPDFYVRVSVAWKNAKIGRVVGTHPSSVMAVQNGFGDYMVEKLYKFCGINLPTAQQLHQRLAMENSLDGDYVTQDQRKASDNILRILCEHELPANVMQFLDGITPRNVEVDGKMHRVHMMCPAGNGYIFPFQTMLFWALIKGVQHVMNVKHDVWVYGDDVICHKSVYNNVNQVYKALGLEVNEDKSFSSGPFRESCGGDFLYGSNVRPLYVKEIPTDTISWIRIINGIRRVGYYNNARTWRSRNFRNLWLRCCRAVQQKERLFCPLHYGDAGINTENGSLYRFAEPDIRAADGIKYPSRIDSKNRPYCQERIYLHIPFEAGQGHDFVAESRNIPARDLLRCLSLGSLSGTGGSLKTFKIRDKVTGHLIGTEQRWVYPKTFGRKHEGYRIEKIPFSTLGQAPTDVDELFSFLLEKSSGGIIHSPSLIMQKHDERRLDVCKALISTLRLVAEKRNNVVKRAQSTVVVFSI